MCEIFIFFSAKMDFIGDIDLVGLLSVILFYFLILESALKWERKISQIAGISISNVFFISNK